jgi:NAD(P)-dependent dehydrogenase (short-subunit alcohol dehydrogenase family)
VVRPLELRAVMEHERLVRLDRRRAVVIGAGSGIGREAAPAPAAHGAEVVCAGRDATRGRARPAAQVANS